MEKDAVIILDPVNGDVIQDGLAKGFAPSPAATARSA